MKIIVEFDSEEEFKARIKNPRKGGGSDDGSDTGQTTAQAPAPLAPPQTQQPFNPAPAPAAFVPPQGFPGATAGAPVADPVVAGLVQRIVTRIDSAIAGGQPADAVLNWFRGQCGAEASAATMDQIKTVFLHKLQAPGLENIAKLMNA
jgi:hypothetical protein